jgi:BirA family transcriptional regulator, biotin operon repressor / biotin---[acetyl-CoA-carboxylase] ligase
MTGKIIRYLKKAGAVVSGQAISDSLGISRVSVWKHVRKLQDLGYTIESTPKGYHLTGSPDKCLPWEFADREANIHYFAQTSSTMDRARELARKGCPHFTVAVAERQDNGRGRLKRTWTSASGGLYFTLVLRPQLPPVLSSRINFAVALTLANLLNEKYKINAMVKWPNDILVAEKKVAGILSEMETEADLLSFFNIGIGINVNNQPPADVAQAAALKDFAGQSLSRRELLADFLNAFEARLETISDNDIVAEWKKQTITLNRMVKIVTLNDTYQGLAVDVDESGALVLQMADGSMKRVVYGDCFHA